MADSCGEYANCRDGDEQYCPDGPVSPYAGPGHDDTPQGGHYTHVIDTTLAWIDTTLAWPAYTP